MKMLLILLSLFCVFSISVFIWGMLIPVKHQVTVKEQIHVPIEDVWQIITDWENQANWRSEVSRIELVSSSKFIEYPKHGPAITFDVIKAQKPHSIVLKMSGSIKGDYVATLSFSEGITTVTATETVLNHSIIGRVISKVFFDLDKFAKSYLLQLKTKAENKSS
ncbi:MAG: SRPBCC family protein [Parashewanella sp.]